MSNDTRSRPMTAETIHTCSYYCERPECIKRQRDELRDRMESGRNRMESALAQRPAAVDGAARRRDVRLWMRHNAGSYSTATELAEAADEVFNLPDGGLDNETHWVWDEAVDAINDAQRDERS